MEITNTQYRDMSEIIPQSTIEAWNRAKNWEHKKLLKAGNKLISDLSRAIVSKYFSEENGYGKHARRYITAFERLDNLDDEGLSGKENILLYWTIERGDKKIHLPIVALHTKDKFVRYAADTNGNLYLMGDRWLNGGDCNMARVELVTKNDRRQKIVKLLDEHGFIKPGEVSPSQLQVDMKGETYLPRKGKVFSSLKGLFWKVEKHTATNILPQFVIEDLELLKN